jgi:mRNA interferase RelE/StbE
VTEAGTWRIIIQRQARRQLRRLPADILRRIMHGIEAIGQDPYRGEMLTGFDYRKWRVGDWRIIYAIEDEQLIVLILGLGARGQIYRRLNQ